MESVISEIKIEKQCSFFSDSFVRDNVEVINQTFCHGKGFQKNPKKIEVFMCKKGGLIVGY